MDYSQFPKVTAYSTMVVSCVDEWAVAAVGELTIKEFADMCGFSITHNLRRRFQNLVDLEILTKTYKLTEDGRWNFVYQPSQAYREIMRQSKLPF